MLHKKMKDNEKNTNSNKKNSRAYMNSYEWNYMVLEIVDYLEGRFAEDMGYGDDPDHVSDPWKNLKSYCLQKNLNWRVIRKMIEFSINAPFESEMELANHESFRRLVKVEDELAKAVETGDPKKEGLLNPFGDEPLKPLKNKGNAPQKEALLDIVF